MGCGVFGVFLRRLHPDQYRADPAIFFDAADGGKGAPCAAAGRGDRTRRVCGVSVPAGCRSSGVDINPNLVSLQRLAPSVIVSGVSLCFREGCLRKQAERGQKKNIALYYSERIINIQGVTNEH